VIGRTDRVALYVIGVCVAAALGFAVLHQPVRAFEAATAIALLRTLGATGVHGGGTSSVLVTPAHHAAFFVLVTPSCSSLASLLSFGCLYPLLPRSSAGRSAVALATAVGVVATGNIIRITASIAIGLVAGRASLVLFHDWVGSMFTFVYTITGFIVMLAMVLPKDGTVRARREVVAVA